ncbi:MAG: transcriptional activator RfaH [Verrucomicrobia bacterium]|nr:transcriptional activator RfaH [Verrucomicrobiota bacterium]
MVDLPIIENPLAWYCLQAQPKHEHIAAASLQRLEGVEAYCPRIRYRKATRRGAVWFIEALFPGYLFARFDFLNSHLSVRHANGVSTILHFGAQIPKIDDQLIASIRALYAGAEHDAIVIDPEITPGSVVSIATGIFAGLETLVTKVMPAKQRVCVLLNILGREVEAQIGNHEVVHPGGSIRMQPGFC